MGNSLRRFVPFFPYSVALSCLCCIGCGEGSKTHEVSGTVTFNGQPVEKGEISFAPLDPSEAPDAGVIVDGKFRFRATAGDKRVEIRGSRPLPANQQTEPEMGPMYEDFIPVQFNTASDLSEEVTSDGSNEFHFDLKDD